MKPWFCFLVQYDPYVGKVVTHPKLSLGGLVALSLISNFHSNSISIKFSTLVNHLASKLIKATVTLRPNRTKTKA